jgi:ATPase subunit of ABC transporter with duplicated ATPase domains
VRQEDLQQARPELNGGDRLAVIGENGVGKTTLLKLLMGELQPQRGSIKWAEKARLGYYAQDHAVDFDSDTQPDRLDRQLRARQRRRGRRSRR